MLKEKNKHSFPHKKVVDPKQHEQTFLQVGN
jgi:hypothetical protein